MDWHKLKRIGSMWMVEIMIYIPYQYHQKVWRCNMRIPLDRQSSTPLYEQIETYLRQGILSVSLTADTRLPASRQLARDLGVNRITVENAYAELETKGLIYSRMGSGTYVLPPSPLLTLSKDGPGAPWPLWQQSVEFQGRIT